MKNRIHFNTYGGNPISMTQGLATLEVIDHDNIQQNAKAVGEQLKDQASDGVAEDIERVHRRTLEDTPYISQA